MKKLLSYLLILIFIITSTTYGAINKTTEIQSFKIGGVPILVPSPTSEMKEVGDDYRERMEILIPRSRRLVAIFLTNDDLLRLEKEDTPAMLEYTSVEVSRRGEFKTIRARDFQKLTDIMNEQLKNKMESYIYDYEEDFNRRMKSLNLEKITLKLDQPIYLGQFFFKPNAYGFGLRLSVSMGTEVFEAVIGGAVVRVNNRIINIYFCSEYENVETIKKVKAALEEWADAILKVNEES